MSWSTSGATSASSSTSATSVSTTASAASSSASLAVSWASGSVLLLHHLELLGVLDEWGLDEVSLWPEIWGQESVSLLEALENGSAEILSGSGLTHTTGVDIIDTSELENLLGNLSGNATSSSWGWDHSDNTGTALALNLDWDGVNTTDSGAPVTSSDWDEVDLGVEKGSLDSDLDLLGDLDTNSDVTLSVTNGNDSLESGSLTGLGLLLDGKDAHDLIGKLSLGVGEESVDDIGLLDWDGVGVDLLKRVDLSRLDESSKLGKWSPVSLSEATSSTWASSGAASAATSATSSASSEASSSSSVSVSWSSICLWCLSFHD